MSLMVGLMIALTMIAIAWNYYRPFTSLLLYACVATSICVIILNKRIEQEYD